MTPDLNAADLIEKIDAGTLPPEFMKFAAQGMLPLPQNELIAVVAHLTKCSLEDVAEVARGTLSDQSPKVLVDFAGSGASGPSQLDSLARATKNNTVLEAIVRNKRTDDATVEALALNGPVAIQEVIVINQERILRKPEILDALLENPAVGPDVRRRALETRNEFFDKKARQAEAAVAEAEAEDDVFEGLDVDESIEEGEIADVLEKAADPDQPENTLSRPQSPDEKKESIWSTVAKMKVAEKVKVAFKGGKTERGILISDRNKLVCSSVVKNPRLSETEVEAYAAMRNVDEEVLRVIGTKRDWMAKYTIAHTLVKNPKAPIGVVMPIVNRLTLKDLKDLTKDRNIPEVLRAQARRLYAQRSKKK